MAAVDKWTRRLTAAQQRVDASKGQGDSPGVDSGPPATGEGTGGGLETRIQEAYQELSTKPQDWVRLARLRETLGNPDDAEMKQILLTMTRTGLVHLAPDSNRKTLKDVDYAAAIRIGSEDKHLIAIEPEYWDTIAAKADDGRSITAPQAGVDQAKAQTKETAAGPKPSADLASDPQTDLAAWQNSTEQEAIADAVNARFEEGGAAALIKRRGDLQGKQDAGTLTTKDRAEMHILGTAIDTAKRMELSRPRSPRPQSKKTVAGASGTLETDLDASSGRPDPQPTAVRRRPARTTSAQVQASPRDSIADTAAHLRQATTREEATTILSGLTKKELTEVATTFDTRLRSGRKADQVNQLVRRAVGARLDHEVIAGGPVPASQLVASADRHGRKQQARAATTTSGSTMPAGGKRTARKEMAATSGPVNRQTPVPEVMVDQSALADDAWGHSLSSTKIAIGKAINKRYAEGGTTALVRRQRYLHGKANKGTLTSRDRAEMHVLPTAIDKAKAKDAATPGGRSAPAQQRTATRSGTRSGDRRTKNTAATRPADMEARIRKAYDELATKKQDWVRLSKLWKKLGNPDKSAREGILQSMVRTGLVHLAPESNRKGLTDDDHAGAMRIGREDKHLIAIELE